MAILNVDGLEVHVVRKRQKNMYVRVRPPQGEIVVTAPLHFTDDEIAWFIQEKKDLILKHRARVRDAASGSAGRDGGVEPKDRTRVDERRRHTGARDAGEDGSAGPVHDRRSHVSGPPTKDELAQWRAVVEAFAPALVERWAPAIGVRPGKLAFRNMVSRWGSCNVKTGRICINVQLAAFPPECLEYVVVHELCHLVEANHGPRFKALLDAHLPHWREAESILRRRGVRR